MIVASMKLKEMHDELEKDVQKLQIWINKTKSKAVKFFEKQNSFPTWYVEKYQNQNSHNQYVIFFYAGTRHEIKSPRYTSYCIVFFENQRYVVRGFRAPQYTTDGEIVIVPQIHAYTSHFFERYNERLLHLDKISSNEIAGLFFVRNPRALPTMLNEEINRNYKEHGDYNKQGMDVNDGFCYTQTGYEEIESEDGIPEHNKVDASLVLYTTFMNELGMSDTQRAAIKKEHVETWKRCMEELKDIITG